MKHIYIATSKIAGMGIMIGEDVKKGDSIFTVKGPVKFKVNQSKKDALANPNWVGISENEWIDPIRPYKFLNHSCDPNSGIKGKVTLAALRNIKEGEEITIDYSIIEGDERWEMPCACGAKKCRKIVKSIQYLPKKVYNSYLPFIAKPFQKLYQKTLKNKLA